MLKKDWYKTDFINCLVVSVVLVILILTIRWFCIYEKKNVFVSSYFLQKNQSDAFDIIWGYDKYYSSFIFQSLVCLRHWSMGSNIVWTWTYFLIKFCNEWKVYEIGDFLVSFFPHWDWSNLHIEWEHRKMQTRKTPYRDTFQSESIIWIFK